MNNDVVSNAVLDIFNEIGEDTSRKGIVDTPQRIVNMYEELFRGYKVDPPKVTTFPNGEDGVKVDEMIRDTGYFFSMCEHHMMPFFGEYYFGYIPDKKILGLSKVARVVDHFSAKLQIQERLTEEIVQYIKEKVNPKGIALVLKGRHLCKEMRGVKKVHGEMTTSVLKDVFRKPEVRSEFFMLSKL